jgi:NADH-quinone oxidoreductase subunit M
LLSKAGIYGFLRLGLELFPQWLHSYGPWLLPLAIAGTLYGALAAWQQHSFKRLIAYASLSHVNFILAGIFVWNEVAHQGALLQAVNHAIVIAALFLVASWFQERINFAEAPSGLMKYFPTLGWLTLFIVMAAIAIPGSNSFVGELMILFGLFKVYPWHAAVLGLSIILSAIYMLGWLQRNYFGPAVDIPDLKGDISLKELTICLPLLALILAIGIYPAPILEYVQPAIQTTKVNMTTSEMLP